MSRPPSPRLPRPTIRFLLAPSILALMFSAAWAGDREDIVVADFEGDDYAGWTADGTAFGTGPARGTCPARCTSTGSSAGGWSTASSAATTRPAP